METIKFKTCLHGRFAIVEINPWNQTMWNITTVNAKDTETACGCQNCELTEVYCSSRTTRWTFQNNEHFRFSFKREFEDFLERNIFFKEVPYENIF